MQGAQDHKHVNSFHSCRESDHTDMTARQEVKASSVLWFQPLRRPFGEIGQNAVGTGAFKGDE